ncbi:MAG: bifunctional DNA-formamidopyrimidine glycosylase/DNA-(apurinic or apyrimidinic site) lyase [Planctomycetes bacterium]|nr:bifunctional DNA-formamidopyrimidine glycosylase/DNA-(apurinic or apyrimidinic site) lyase [Planctomycetota bacterium]NUQ34277.1 bifunctional DNA-formamidopyrimidine glycosylase/DNA-(apurinic or apyrimidinic site) lyase [Planctomycetaceae bacterium]
MPELPEVESIRRKLVPMVAGRRIRDVSAVARNYAFLSDPGIIRKKLSGGTVEAIERRGKYLLLRLKQRGALLIHLGMTGQIFSHAYEPDKHVHMTLVFAGLRHPVYFRDPRKFGKLLWLDPGEEYTEPRLTKLGHDALSFSAEYLGKACRNRSVAIKSLLLNQSVLAGAGNIYADEALFTARIRPTRRARTLNSKETGALTKALRNVLERAVKLGGSSINDYIHPDGSEGYFQIEHKVYGREGAPCLTCATAIKRSVIGQRSAHYCPRCQR